MSTQTPASPPTSDGRPDDSAAGGPLPAAPRDLPPPQDERPSAQHLRIASALALGSFMVMIDTTVVNVATHTLAAHFHTSLTTVAWVSTAYLLTLSLVIPLSGWAMERYGGKRVWLSAVAAFCAASLLCAAAWSISSLIVFRIVQGLGGALIAPVGQALIGRTVGPRLMARVMALLAVPMMLAPVIGPVVGGLLVDDLDWRWIFYVNLPLGVVAVALVARYLPAQPATRAQRLDVRGLLLVSPGLAAIVYGCAEAGDAGGFGAPRVVASLVGGALLLAAFAWYSLRASAAPLLDLRLLRDRYAGSAMLNSLLLGASMYGAMFLLPFYYQQVRGADALHAGLYLAPQGLGAAAASVVAGRLGNRLGARVLVAAGTVTAALGTIPFALIGPDTARAGLAASLAVRGVGLGLMLSPLFAAAYANLERSAIPRATTLFNILNRLGGSLGTAVLAVVLQRALTRGGGTGTAAVAAHTSHAYATAFAWALGLTAVGLIPALLLPGATRTARVRGGAVKGVPK